MAVLASANADLPHSVLHYSDLNDAERGSDMNSQHGLPLLASHFVYHCSPVEACTQAIAKAQTSSFDSRKKAVKSGVKHDLTNNGVAEIL